MISHHQPRCLHLQIESYTHRDLICYFSMPTDSNMLLFTLILWGSTSMPSLYMLVSNNVMIYVLKLIIKLPTFSTPQVLRNERLARVPSEQVCL